MSDILTVQNLHSGYKDNLVVDNVSFAAKSGEILGLIGLNGAGKTTLIKTILGLRQPIEGDIQIPKNGVAYLPEKFEPPHFLSGYKFIKFSMRLHGKDCSFEDIKEQSEKLSFDSNFLDKSVTHYSKGMKQKIGLLATLLSDCPLTILDEPMSGLDPKARQEIKRMIISAKRSGKSIFMSSHILADMTELCDRIAVFDDKKIQFLGTPEAFLKKGQSENPEKAFLSIISD